MDVFTTDVADLFEAGEPDDVPLGTALRGRFADAETDSVEAVRDLRERERR
jgi:hypothetical protein